MKQRMTYVPTIDMGQADGGNNPAFVQALGRACEEIGFAVLTGHDLDPALCDEMYGVMREVFELPLRVLQQYETAENGRQTGYTSPQVEKAKDAKVADLKEFWHARRHLPIGHPSRERAAFVPNLWPTEVPRFEGVAMRLFAELDRLSGVTLTALNHYLDLPANTLPGMIVDGETLLRLLHYPPVPSALAEQGFVRAGAHEDINLVTLLPAATASGLEVKTRDGDWISVNETPGSLVMNVGDMLQRFTGERMVSTTHRVMNPPRGDSGSRYSIPFFAHPRGEVVLDPDTGLTAGAYLHRRLVEIGLIKA